MAKTQKALETAQDGFRRATPAAKCSSIKDVTKFCGEDTALIADPDSKSCDSPVCQPGAGGDTKTCCVATCSSVKDASKFCDAGMELSADADKISCEARGGVCNRLLDKDKCCVPKPAVEGLVKTNKPGEGGSMMVRPAVKRCRRRRTAEHRAI